MENFGQSGPSGRRECFFGAIDVRGLHSERAQGVDSPEQACLLRHVKCDLLQGLLTGRPAPAADYGAGARHALIALDNAITESIPLPLPGSAGQQLSTLPAPVR